MKRLFCTLLGILLLLVGCDQEAIKPGTGNKTGETKPLASAASSHTPTPLPQTAAPVCTSTPEPILPTFAPKTSQEALFAEELLSHDGEPVCSRIHSLLSNSRMTRQDFHDRFMDIIRQTEALDGSVRLLSEKGRTMTGYRKEMTMNALTQLASDDTLTALETAYARLSGESEELPLLEYTQALDTLMETIQSMEERTLPFFSLDKNGAKEYRAVLARFMGESADPQNMMNALEDLAQTEAYALYTAMQADPEVVRKKEPISFGGFTRNLSFLRNVTQSHYPLPNGIVLTIPYGDEADREKDLMQLAFRYYPGLMYLKQYADNTPKAQIARWENAPDGYLAGLAVHNCYAITQYLDEFELEYVQYRWNEDMLYVTLTGICSLLIHYYGYSEDDLSAYLQRWGAEDFTVELYDKAMFDPFESLIASYGYYQYLDICQAALDAGCESEEQFFADYMAAGPAPFRELKEYMVTLYQKQG